MPIYLSAQPDYYDKNLNPDDFARILACVENQKSGEYLCVDDTAGITIISRAAKCWQVFKGWLGFENQTHSKRVQSELLKIVYQIELAQNKDPTIQDYFNRINNRLQGKKVQTVVSQAFKALAEASKEVNRDAVRKKLQKLLLDFHTDHQKKLTPNFWKRKLSCCTVEIDLPPGHAFGDTYLELAKMEMKKYYYERTLNYFDKAIALDNADPAFQQKMAKEFPFEALRHNAERVDAIFVALGNRALRSNRHLEAIDLYERAFNLRRWNSESVPQLLRLHEQVADNHFRGNEYQNALKHYQKAKSYADGYQHAHYDVKAALVYIAMGEQQEKAANLPQAIECYKKARGLNKNLANDLDRRILNLHIALGEKQIKEENFNQAIEIYVQAKEQIPTFVNELNLRIFNIYLTIAEKALAKNDFKGVNRAYDNAEKHISKNSIQFAQLNEKRALVYQPLAQRHQANKNYDDAITLYDYIIKLKGIPERLKEQALVGLESSYTALSDSARAKEKWVDSISNANKALDVSRKNEVSLSARIALAFLKLRERGHALPYFKKFTAKNLTDPKLVEAIRTELEMMSKYVKLDQEILSAYEQLPEGFDCPILKATYVNTCIRLGDKEKTSSQSTTSKVFNWIPTFGITTSSKSHSHNSVRYYETALRNASKEQLKAGINWLQQLLDIYLSLGEKNKIAVFFDILQKNDVLNSLNFNLSNVTFEQTKQFVIDKKDEMVEIIVQLWHHQKKYQQVIDLYVQSLAKSECCVKWFIKARVALARPLYEDYQSPVGNAVSATFASIAGSETPFEKAKKQYDIVWRIWRQSVKKANFNPETDFEWISHYIRLHEDENKAKEACEIYLTTIESSPFAKIIIGEKTASLVKLASEKLFNDGNCYSEWKDWDKAIHHYIRALRCIEWDRTIPRWYQELVENFIKALRQYQAEGHPDSKKLCLQYVTEAIRCQKGTAQFHFFRAELLEEIGQNSLIDIHKDYELAVLHSPKYFQPDDISGVILDNPFERNQLFVDNQSNPDEDNKPENLRVRIGINRNMAILWGGAYAGAIKVEN